MPTKSPTTAEHARCARRAALVVVWLALGACIDERVSLGNHQAPLAPDAGGMLPDMSMTGGQPAPTLDAGAIDARTIEPEPDAAPTAPLSACQGSMYAVTLSCMIDPFGMPPPDSESSMTTQSVMVFERAPFGGPTERALVRGELDFEAWDLSFHARLAGELDCSNGILHIELVDGLARPTLMPGPDIAFVGQIDGSLNDQDDTLQGRWWHAPISGNTGCMGFWSAVRRN